MSFVISKNVSRTSQDKKTQSLQNEFFKVKFSEKMDIFEKNYISQNENWKKRKNESFLWLSFMTHNKKIILNRP